MLSLPLHNEGHTRREQGLEKTSPLAWLIALEMRDSRPVGARASARATLMNPFHDDTDTATH
jgi:hypothetical protein